MIKNYYVLGGALAVAFISSGCAASSNHSEAAHAATSPCNSSTIASRSEWAPHATESTNLEEVWRAGVARSTSSDSRAEIDWRTGMGKSAQVANSCHARQDATL